MGAWGLDSCSSDSCWDLLGDGGIEDIDDIRQEEVDSCMEVVMEAEDCSYYPRYKLGAAIWLLDHGMTLKPAHIKWALSEVDKFIGEYEDAIAKGAVEGGPDAEEYIQTIRSERERILEAQKNGGQGSEYHADGLMEKISRAMGDSGLGGMVNVHDKAAETHQG
jgi:hypothetical protein